MAWCQSILVRKSGCVKIVRSHAWLCRLEEAKSESLVSHTNIATVLTLEKHRIQANKIQISQIQLIFLTITKAARSVKLASPIGNPKESTIYPKAYSLAKEIAQLSRRGYHTNGVLMINSVARCFSKLASRS